MQTEMFTSRPIPNGGTYTLTTYFGDMLARAEALYGARDLQWTPIGVEFFAGDVPHIWFPGNSKRVCIRLTLSALRDHDEAIWQLSQEIVHVLAPASADSVTRLEEGVATHFALNMSAHYRDPSRLARNRAKMEGPGALYSGPLKDCEALLSLDPDVIRKLRAIQPSLSRVAAQDIWKTVPACEPALAARLTNRFR